MKQNRSHDDSCPRQGAKRLLPGGAPQVLMAAPFDKLPLVTHDMIWGLFNETLLAEALDNSPFDEVRCAALRHAVPRCDGQLHCAGAAAKDCSAGTGSTHRQPGGWSCARLAALLLSGLAAGSRAPRCHMLPACQAWRAACAAWRRQGSRSPEPALNAMHAIAGAQRWLAAALPACPRTAAELRSQAR